MGKNNRARRAAKAKPRSARHQARTGTDMGAGRGGGPEQSRRDLARELVERAVFAALAGPHGKTVAPSVLAQLAGLPPAVVDPELAGQLRRVVAVLWSRGWQPVELVRQVRRASSAAGARLGTATVLADHAARSPDTLHPAWAEQIAQLRAGVSAGPNGSAAPESGWFESWARRESLSRAELVSQTLQVCHVLVDMRPLEQLLPPPGQQDQAESGPQRPWQAPTDSPILARVRALLAQAESTTFPAEAEAFTAKAQELMTRYAIDHALLHGGAPGERPVARRIPIDEPYLDAKSFLLHVVTQHNRTKSVFHQHYAFATVVGFEADLAATDMLFTSLLVQAQTALTAEGRNASAGARTRSRSFRSSFLVAYADRIGDRLEEINHAVLREVPSTEQRNALPVLAARRDEVEDTVAAMFPTLGSSTVSSGWDGMGALRGRMAADAAKLNFADLPTPVTV